MIEPFTSGKPYLEQKETLPALSRYSRYSLPEAASKTACYALGAITVLSLLPSADAGPIAWAACIAACEAVAAAATAATAGAAAPSLIACVNACWAVLPLPFPP